MKSSEKHGFCELPIVLIGMDKRQGCNKLIEERKGYGTAGVWLGPLLAAALQHFYDEEMMEWVRGLV